MTAIVEVSPQQFARDTQKAIARLETGLDAMRKEETPEAYALLSESWIELLERRRHEIAERFLPAPEELTQAHEKVPPDLSYRAAQVLEALVSKQDARLRQLRQRTIETLTEDDKEAVLEVFAEFAEVLKPVGAAKALHLLAPRFFPLWDNKIAKAYGLPHRPKATPQDDARCYWQFMQVVKWQVKLLKERYGEQLPDFARQNLLKALDEWNYAKFTKRWL